MATAAAAAASVPVGGGPVGGGPPAVIVPELPDATALASVLNTPGGMAAAILDIYGHVRGLGNSVTAFLQAHVSSNNINQSEKN